MSQSFIPNTGQQAALSAPPDATLAIIAGAGTGKTETLARRYVKLLTHDTTLHPRNIVVLTFTEKAATEMRARIMYTVINESLPFSRVDMAEAQISTFHAFAARLALQRSIALNLNPDEPFCEERERDIIGQACWERFLDHGWQEAIAHLTSIIDQIDWNDESVYVTLNQMIADAKGLGLESHTLIDAINQTSSMSAKHDLFGHLLAWNFVARAHDLSQRGQLDLDDLIRIVPLICNRFPELFAHVRYVMIDEYQDTSIAQANLLESITPQHQGAAIARTVVGDPRQAIYVWRQANVQNIVYMKQHSQITVNLTENRRSLAPILAVANRSLATYQFSNPVEFDADAQLHPPPSAPAAGDDCVRFWAMAGREAESQAIAARMIELHQQYGIDYGDMAVLLRQRTHLDIYAHAMLEAGIPFDRGKSDPFYHRPLILDAIHLLIACYDPSNEQSLTRALLSATRTCDDIGLRAIRQQERDTSLWRLIQKSGEIHPQIGQFADTLSRTQHLQWQLPPAEWFAATIERFGLWQRDGAYGQRMLTKLINDCRSMQTGSSHDLIRELLERIRHEPDSASPELKTNNNAVQIMTVHAAKGLEFTAVFVPDAHAFDLRSNTQMTFQNGTLVDPSSEEPSQRTIYTELERQQYNEVVALWYVALTRAKRFLMVSAVTGTRNNGKNSLFSRMLESLKQAPLEGVDITPIETASPSNTSQPQQPTTIATAMPQRIASKQIIALSPSALHELDQCPKRYRFQRRSGLDDLLDSDDTTHTAFWTDTPQGHYTLPNHLDAWQGLASEAHEFRVVDDPQAAGKSARAIGSLFHLATELHAHHPQASAHQLCTLAVQRYDKLVSQETTQLLVSMLDIYLSSVLGQTPPQLHDVEQRIRWRIETPRALVEMTGIIDRQWNGMIIDYKTDESLDGIIERHGDQLRLYAHAWMRQHQRADIPAIAVYHARTGTLISIPNDELLMRQTQQRVATAAIHIVAGDYPARPVLGYCRHCPAQAICAEGRTLVPPQEIPAFEPFGW